MSTTTTTTTTTNIQKKIFASAIYIHFNHNTTTNWDKKSLLEVLTLCVNESSMLHLPVFIVSNCFCSRPLPCCSSCVVIYIISSSPWVGSPFPPKKNYVLMSFLCLIAIIHCSFIIVPCNQLLWDVNSQNQIFTQHIFRFWVSGQEEKTADQIILSYLKSFQSFNPKQMWPLTGRHT